MVKIQERKIKFGLVGIIKYKNGMNIKMLIMKNEFFYNRLILIFKNIYILKLQI
jgi:hypothetical protein